MAKGTVDQIRSQIPDEFLDQFNGWVSEIEYRTKWVKVVCETYFEQAPKQSRKDFALWVSEHHKDLAPYLFKMLDGQDISDLIYKREFEMFGDKRVLNVSEDVS